jgi:DNA invertase Pin-like site-specific DNA recombinase
MKIGYARVSTKHKQQENGLATQVAALKAAGCERIFDEQMSGARQDRPVLADVFDRLREGDELVVYDVSRLSRRMLHAMEFVRRLLDRDIAFRSLTDGIGNIEGAMGMAMLQMMFVFAELGSSQAREKINAGLENAKANGVRLGRPDALDEDQMKAVISLMDDRSKNKLSAEQIAEQVGCSRATVYNVYNNEHLATGDAE